MTREEVEKDHEITLRHIAQRLEASAKSGHAVSYTELCDFAAVLHRLANDLGPKARRAEYAAMAMQGLCAAMTGYTPATIIDPASLTSDAVDMADALIVELGEVPPSVGSTA